MPVFNRNWRQAKWPIPGSKRHIVELCLDGLFGKLVFQIGNPFGRPLGQGFEPLDQLDQRF